MTTDPEPPEAPTSGGPSWRPGQPLDDDEFAALVDLQRAVVTMPQCRAAGMSHKRVRGAVVSGRWRLLSRGVYLTLPGRDDWLTRAIAALLACGEEAVLSHESAGHLHGLSAHPPAAVDILIPDARRVTRPRGVLLHRSLHVVARSDDLAWPWRTTVEATVLDLADRTTLDEAIAAAARACATERTTTARLTHALSQRKRHRWRARLLEVFDDIEDGAQSTMEVRYIRDVERAHGLPRGVRQMPTDRGRRLHHDNGYPAQRTIVELDGRLGQEGPDGRRKDGTRDRSTSGGGWLTVRAFWRDVAGTPCELAVDVGDTLRVRGWTGAPHPCRRSTCAVGRAGQG